VPPSNRRDAPHANALELDPIAHFDRAVELQRDAANHVAERALKRDGQDRRHHRGARDRVGRVEATLAERDDDDDRVADSGPRGASPYSS
jgi:hypothetical protein